MLNIDWRLFFTLERSALNQVMQIILGLYSKQKKENKSKTKTTDLQAPSGKYEKNWCYGEVASAINTRR